MSPFKISRNLGHPAAFDNNRSLATTFARALHSFILARIVSARWDFDSYMWAAPPSDGALFWSESVQRFLDAPRPNSYWNKRFGYASN